MWHRDSDQGHSGLQVTRCGIPFLPKKGEKDKADPAETPCALSAAPPTPTSSPPPGPTGASTLGDPFVVSAGSPSDRLLSQFWVTCTSVTQPGQAGGGGCKTRLSGAWGGGASSLSSSLTCPALGRGHSRLDNSELPLREGLRASLRALPWCGGGGTPQLLEKARGCHCSRGPSSTCPEGSIWMDSPTQNQEKQGS